MHSAEGSHQDFQEGGPGTRGRGAREGVSRSINLGFLWTHQGKQSKWLRGLSPDPRQDGKSQSPEREKMWRGPALDWLFAYGEYSKATVVPRGQLGLDEDRIEEMVPEAFWVTICPFHCPGGSEPGKKKGTSTPPLAQALSASPFFLS